MASKRPSEPSDKAAPLIPGQKPWIEDDQGNVITPFRGLRRPRYTQTPDDFFDYVMPFLTGGELKVFLYLIRRTFGFKQDGAAVSLSQLSGGLELYNGGANLHRRYVAKVLKSLEAKGLITREKRFSRDGEPLETVYSVKLDDEG